MGVAQITGSLIDDFGENGAGGPAMQEAQRWRQTTSNESQRPAAIQNPRGKQGMIDNNRMRIDKWLWVASDQARRPADSWHPGVGQTQRPNALARRLAARLRHRADTARTLRRPNRRLRLGRLPALFSERNWAERYEQGTATAKEWRENRFRFF